MPAATEWRASLESDVSLTGATPKTVLAAIATTGHLITLTQWGISFKGTATTQEAVLVELCKWDGTNTGTATSVTSRQIRGVPLFAPSSFAATRNYTVEPTVLTLIEPHLIEPKSGLYVIQYPLGREPTPVQTGDGLAIRCTAPNAVSCRAHMSIEEV